MHMIDLRSDTVTRPSDAMRRAIAEADVGDDVFGDDPTVIELESYVASLFGREAALFVPSGTMANQICLKAQTSPGQELLCDRECHVVHYEASGPVLHAGLLVNMFTTEHGMLSADTVRNNVRIRTLHSPETRIVELENTHNRHGGTILPQDEIVRVREVCDEFGLRLHLDGARIWNASVASGLSLEEITRPFHSISCCLSKGLGAPIGSMIVGSASFVETCRYERKLFGGAMRQVGIIAAAGLYAVKNNIARLAEDHTNAAYLAGELNKFAEFDLDMETVQTNIIVADLAAGLASADIAEKAKSVGVGCVPFGPHKVRFVTHLDVSRADCEEAISRLKTVLT